MAGDVRALRAVQCWLFDAIADPRPAETVIAHLAPEVDAILAPTVGQTAAASLEVYRRMGQARFEAALRDDHEALAALLGSERFASLVRDFLTRHPSTRWTLDGLDAGLPDFLARWEGVSDAERAPLTDLARFETTIAAVRLSPFVATLERDALAEAAPGRLETVRLVAAPSLVVLELDHDAMEAVERCETSRRPAWPPRRAVAIAVLRTRRGVRWFREPSESIALLRALAGGTPLGRALETCDGLDAAGIQGAFARWSEAGVFVALG